MRSDCLRTSQSEKHHHPQNFSSEGQQWTGEPEAISKGGKGAQQDICTKPHHPHTKPTRAPFSGAPTGSAETLRPGASGGKIPTPPESSVPEIKPFSWARSTVDRFSAGEGREEGNQGVFKSVSDDGGEDERVGVTREHDEKGDNKRKPRLGIEVHWETPWSCHRTCWQVAGSQLCMTPRSSQEDRRGMDCANNQPNLPR